MDISTVKLENTSFVELDLTDKYSDVIFSAKFNNTDGYIYLLLEHQSTADPFMALRLFRYMLNICDRYLTENQQEKYLPIIYHLIYYNGIQNYNISRNLWSIFQSPRLAREFWTNDYQLVNVHEIPDEELKKRTWSGILDFFMKHINERELLSRWQEIAYMLPEIINVNIGYDYIERQQQFISTYIYGAACHDTGEAFALILPYANTQAMNKFLEELSRSIQGNRHIALLTDNAGWHTAKKLTVPSNITLIPLPPYAPELNAMEQVWEWINNHFLSNQCYGVYEDIVTMACYAWNQLAHNVDLVKSIMYRDWINIPC